MRLIVMKVRGYFTNVVFFQKKYIFTGKVHSSSVYLKKNVCIVSAIKVNMYGSVSVLQQGNLILT